MPQVSKSKYTCMLALKQLTIKLNNARKQIIEAKDIINETTSNTYVKCQQEIDSLSFALDSVKQQYSTFIKESDGLVEVLGDECDSESYENEAMAQTENIENISQQIHDTLKLLRYYVAEGDLIRTRDDKEESDLLTQKQEENIERRHKEYLEADEKRHLD